MTAFTVSGINGVGMRAHVGAVAAQAASPRSSDAARLPPASTAAIALRARLRAVESARASRTRQTRQLAVNAIRGEVRAAQARRERARERALHTWVVPVLGYRLTAGFGSISALWASSHTGQDFAAPYGTAVRAIGAGRIIFAGWDGSYGLKIVIEHADGTVSWYAHMSCTVRTSGDVGAGEVIGRVGSTGNSTGNHLHLEIRPGGGGPVPPLTWMREHNVRV